MTLYLRTKEGNTVVDIELYKAVEEEYKFVEISAVIDIREYSKFLLSNFESKEVPIEEIITDFDQISEIRGWMYEIYFQVKENTHEEYENVLKLVKDQLNYLAKKYKLYLVTD